MKVQKLIITTVVLLSSCLTAAESFAQTNQIYNPGFEMGPSRPNGNGIVLANTGNAVGWVLNLSSNSNTNLNVVQVDGPGGSNYGNDGPEHDATGLATLNAPRRYLDIPGTSGKVYQRITPQCTGPVRFGAFFSTRDDQGGTGSIRIVNASDPSSPTVGASIPVNLPAGNSATDLWILSSGVGNLTANTTYTIEVAMNNELNMDEAYVYFNDCDLVPKLPDVENPQWPTGTNLEFPSTDPVVGLGPCCGPWHEGLIPQSLQPQFPATTNDPYNMLYQTPTASDAAMKSYLLYVNAMDPTITEVKLVWQAANLGIVAAPSASGPIVPAGGTVTWTITGPGIVTATGTPLPGWPSAPFIKNTWYGFMTTLTHNGTQKSPYFKDDCKKNWWYFRWVSSGFKSSGSANSGRFETFKNGMPVTVDGLKAPK